MAENTPPNRDNQNPWNRRPPESGPPDLIALIKKLFHKASSSKPSSTSQSSTPSKQLPHFGSLVGIVAAVIVLLWALSGIFLVAPAEQAVILRLGKYVNTVGPGPHWIPRFLDTQTKVNVQRIDSFPYHSEMLSKDENIVSVKLQVQYRISNPRDYLFNVVDPVATLKQAVSSALRQMVGQMDLDPLITTGRSYLADHVNLQLKSILDRYQTGLEVVDVALQEVKPPNAVTAAFDDVVKAREDRQSYINKATAYAKKRVLIAQGTAARLEQEADAYQFTVVAQARGETAQFLALLKPYQQAPSVIQQRLYLDTMTHVLSQTKTILVDIKNGNNMLYLPLSAWKQSKLPNMSNEEAEAEDAADKSTSDTQAQEMSTADFKHSYSPRPVYNN